MKHLLIIIIISLFPIILIAQSAEFRFKKASLKESGLDSLKIVEVEKNIKKGMYGDVTSVIIYHKGNLVFEKYYNGFHSNELHTMRSGMKSISSLLIGIAIQQKLISSEKEKVMKFYSAEKIQNIDERKNQISIEDVLKMASGIDWHEWSPPITDPNNSIVQMTNAPNQAIYVLNQKMDTLPNTKFLYNSGHSEILDDIILKSSNKNAAQFAKQNLFDPLGIKDFFWKDGSFTEKSSADIKYDKKEISLNLKSIDMLKLGVLVLNKGVWEGKQIINSDWIQKTFLPYFQPFSKTPVYYGYQWWMTYYPTGFKIYNTAGSGDQYINVIPDMDMVIVTTAKNFSPNEKIDGGAIRFDILKAHPLYKSLLILKTDSILKIPFNEVKEPNSNLGNISSDLLDFGFAKEVIEITDIVVKRNEASYRTYMRRGKAYLLLNDLINAKKAFEKSLSINPTMTYFEKSDANYCKKELKLKS